MKVLQVYTRVYVNDMETSLIFYENLLSEVSTFRFKYEAAGLELASVGDILILAGSNQALEPFRKTKATFKVDSIHKFYDLLKSSGCKIIRDLTRVPTGTNFTVQHPDGEIFEYVQHHD
ncbi:VOC family protein [Paenibacillus sp. Y412MC10]|uniref:VOC family protein n=1 Tax=Geobacillus sp. (strain Y412MC10) TaxID=481743 RepID=UPI0011AB3F2C|nr:VOC family protein [Paenibacillus sp. Y412MC10]